MNQLSRWAMVLAMMAGFGLACSSAAPVGDEIPAEESGPTEDGVEADELAEHPCGNPDWEEEPPPATSLETENED